LLQIDQNKDGKLNGGGKSQNKKGTGGNYDQNKDIVHDNDKSHSHWHLKRE
jgi:hypothetical protein